MKLSQVQMIFWDFKNILKIPYNIRPINDNHYQKIMDILILVSHLFSSIYHRYWGARKHIKPNKRQPLAKINGDFNTSHVIFFCHYIIAIEEQGNIKKKSPVFLNYFVLNGGGVRPKVNKGCVPIFQIIFTLMVCNVYSKVLSRTTICNLPLAITLFRKKLLF